MCSDELNCHFGRHIDGFDCVRAGHSVYHGNLEGRRRRKFLKFCLSIPWRKHYVCQVHDFR